MGLTIDHTISWEIARVGGLVAYVLATASVVLGLLLSLGVRSPKWPRFITNELHRFLSLLTLVFVAIHTLAVLVDPFTAFTPSEVLVPFVAHYRPLWIAFGIVSGYLVLAVWASEYVRGRIGYAWWRRFHFTSFVVFALGLLHGVGTGSDTREWWALALYGVTLGAVVSLIGWRLVRALDAAWRDAAVGALAILHAAVAIFILVGPAQAGWNAVANSGNGDGASGSWVAAQAAADTDASTRAISDPAGFSAKLLPATAEDGDSFTWIFSVDGHGGTVQLMLGRQSASVAVSLDSGWSCQGFIAQATNTSLSATCSTSTGGLATVRLDQLHREASGVSGVLKVVAG
jgi:hypothetical protein